MPAVSDVRVEGSVCEVERSDDMTDDTKALVLVSVILIILWVGVFVAAQVELQTGL